MNYLRVQFVCLLLLVVATLQAYSSNITDVEDTELDYISNSNSNSDKVNFTCSTEDGNYFTAEVFSDSGIEIISWGFYDAVDGRLFISITSENFSNNVSFVSDNSTISGVFWADFSYNGSSDIMKAFQVEFLGPSPHKPIAIITDTGGDYARNTITIEGEIFTSNQSQSFDTRFSLCSLESYQGDGCENMLNSIFDPSSTEVSIPINLQWNGNRFAISISIDENRDILQDGAYYPVVSVRDENLLSSHTVSKVVIVDSTEPDSIIIGPDQVVEGLGIVVLDGSSSSDQISEIHYSWIITEPDGSVRGPTETEAEGHFLNIIPSISGTWQFKLEVTDFAGNKNSTFHNMSVSNTPPTANIELDGLVLSDGSMYRLPDQNHWNFSAYNSTDTENDIGNLEYSWTLEGVEICTHSNCSLLKDDLTELKALNVTITDDDGESAYFTIDVVIFESEDDPLSEKGSSGFIEKTVGNIGLISAVLILVIVGIIAMLFVWSIKNRASSLKIPKWKED